MRAASNCTFYLKSLEVFKGVETSTTKNQNNKYRKLPNKNKKSKTSKNQLLGSKTVYLKVFRTPKLIKLNYFEFLIGELYNF